MISLLCWLLICSTVRAQQCRLKKKNNAVMDNPSNPTVIPDPAPNITTTGTPTSTTRPTSSPQPFDYTTDMIRGVNLGGWFVLEPWITPSIFENTNNTAIIDEYTFGQYQDKDVALAVLEKHWSTWIVEDDFRAIQAAGLNHVRIPLGYWSVPLTSADTAFSTSVAPYIPGAWPYLLKALEWAKTYNLNTIIDVHGAPGSQNGYDNSGQLIPNPTWATNATNVARTIEMVRFVASKLAGMVDMIELMNEPKGYLGDPWPTVLRQYYSDGYTTVRKEAGDDIKIMISDGFLTVQGWTNFLTYPAAQGVLMDYHEYQIFSPLELSRSFDEHISYACSLIPDLVTYSTQNIWTVIGEWSTAPTDCAKWLNGRGVGSRWDGTYFPTAETQAFGSCNGWTGDSKGFSDAYKAFLRKYFEVQVEIGESLKGWVYWTWKTEMADEWNYQQGLQDGWIPSDPSDRLYPNICG